MTEEDREMNQEGKLEETEKCFEWKRRKMTEEIEEGEARNNKKTRSILTR